MRTCSFVGGRISPSAWVTRARTRNWTSATPIRVACCAWIPADRTCSRAPVSSSSSPQGGGRGRDSQPSGIGRSEASVFLDGGLHLLRTALGRGAHFLGPFLHGFTDRFGIALDRLAELFGTLSDRLVGCVGRAVCA